MSGTFTPKVLAEGQVSTSPTVIYTAPAVTKAYIYTANFVNVSAGSTSESVTVYFKRATQREIANGVLTARKWRLEALDHPLHLEAGDQLLAVTSNAASVDFVVTGVEET